MMRSCRLAVLFAVLLFLVPACSESGDGDSDCAGAICGGSCVDTRSDEAHCGGCGNACPDGQSCTGGVCCPDGQGLCGGACTDLTRRASCGACGVRCGENEACMEGSAGWACVACIAGQILCGDRCVDPAGDGANCGGCGNACDEGQVCSGGVCTSSCGEGQTACGTSCVDTSSDFQHCGGCDNRCPSNQLCFDGACGCRPTEIQCGDLCADPQRSVAHCGRCDNACATGLRCVDGECMLVCRPEETVCGTTCADLGSDPANCGACGRTCAAGAVCLGGECECPTNTVLCNDFCVDPRNDARNCGGCGNVCPVGQRCEAGECTANCRAGETLCGEACADLNTHPAHCGTCFTECPAGQACVQGACVTRDLPDLLVDVDDLTSSIDIVVETFPPNDCAIVEGCVAGDGQRRLLRFSTTTPNLGTADFHIGPPGNNPHLIYSPCHGHYHFEEYASYRLLDMEGNVAAVGHKQAFCLMDTGIADPNAPPRQTVHSCSNQGISLGWSDTYGRGLDCQWVDITGVPPGRYLLEVSVNPARIFAELDYSNNAVQVPVEIPFDPNLCVPTSEVCYNGIDEDCDGVPDDGCPPLEGLDTCENAFTLPRAGTVVEALITPTTGDDVASSCGAGGKDVIFRIDLAAEQMVYLSTFGSEVPTSLSIRSGSCNGAEVACVDDACGTRNEQWVGTLPAGVHYVMVEGHEVTAPAKVRLKAQFAECTGAQPLASGVTVTGNTTGGTNTRTTCNSRGSGPDQYWYFTTCPGSRTVTATTCGNTNFDTLIGILPGSCRALPVVCNDDSPCASNQNASAVSTTLDGDGLWFTVVDGYMSRDQGSYSLTVTW